MGGIGKTQLALKYSLDFADQYAGIRWFDAENETRLQLQAQDFCQQSGVPQAPDELPTTATRRCRGIFFHARAIIAAHSHHGTGHRLGSDRRWCG